MMTTEAPTSAARMMRFCRPVVNEKKVAGGTALAGVSQSASVLHRRPPFSNPAWCRSRAQITRVREAWKSNAPGSFAPGSLLTNPLS